MNPWIGYGLLDGGILVALALAIWICHALDRRQEHVNRVIDRALADMDRRPEFGPAPADWPLRESPPRGRRR